MTRFEFLRKLGFGGSALLTALCLGQSSCKEDDKTSSSSKDFTLDLNQAAFSKLKTPGNFIVEQDVVVACTGPGAYAAVTVICSHEGQKQVAYQAGSNDFRCSAHGATFDVQGKGKSGPSSAGLRTYQTSLSGNSLRVFS
jgi:nitrite reductase/ring-hydroxylating ferredoxin subunit